MRALLDVLKSFAVGVWVVSILVATFVAIDQAIPGSSPYPKPAPQVLLVFNVIALLVLAGVVVVIGEGIRDIHRGRPR